MINTTFALFVLAATTADGSPPLKTLEFSGVARTEDGRLFYRETHQVRHRGGVPVHAVTTYENGEGRVLATLTTDFSKDRFAPDYEMRDPDGRLLRMVTNRGTSLRLGDTVKTIDLLAPATNRSRLVTGQGIDQYARFYRSALASGQSLVVRFPIPTRHDVYSFRLRAIDSKRSDVVRVEIGIDNFLLALLAPTIVADYDVQTGRLLRYHGVSNLTDERGDNPMVEILYSYGDRP